ncbi:MAG: acylhydrolase [Firmicutes bacterium]|nr:acylhydrolase [Bacillota bacterium]
MSDPVKIFCYGDSNTYGYDPKTGLRHPRQVRWTGRLSRMLGPEYQVVEEGCNGRTTVFPQPGEEWKSGLYGLKVCLSTYKPVEVMVLMLGTNDLKNYYGASAEQVAEGAETIARQAESFMMEKCGTKPVIVLVSPIFIREGIENTRFGYEFDGASIRKSHELAPLYEEIARKHGYIFLDAAKHAQASGDDCLHMGPEGHEALAEAVYDKVLEALERLAVRK